MSLSASVGVFPTRRWADVAALLEQPLHDDRGPIGVALIDVDHSTRLASTSAGIESLAAAVATRLAPLLLPHDLTARVDVDTFLVVRHPLRAPAETEGLGRRIVDRVDANALSVAGVATACTVSVGVAVSRPGDSGSALLRYAQHALDDAKTLGRNRLTVFADEDRDLLADIDNA